jgi:hypothetical protein
MLNENSIKQLEELAEGNNDLFNALKSCNENGLKTFACCAGHDIQDDSPNPHKPYIGIIFNKDNLSKIKNIVASMEDIPQFNMVVVVRYFDCIPPERQKAIAFHGTLDRRKEFFDNISKQSVSQEISIIKSKRAQDFFNKIVEIAGYSQDEIVKKYTRNQGEQYEYRTDLSPNAVLNSIYDKIRYSNFGIQIKCALEQIFPQKDINTTPSQWEKII